MNNIKCWHLQTKYHNLGKSYQQSCCRTQLSSRPCLFYIV